MGISRHASSALMAVCAVVVGACSNAPSIGGRPLIYPNQRGDVTEEKAGIVRKVAPSEAAAPERSAAYTPPAPAPRAPEPSVAAPRPAPPAAVAQAAPAPSRPGLAGDDSFNRYTQAKIVVVETAAEAEMTAGTFPVNDVDLFGRVAHSVLGARVENKGHDIVISR